MKGVINVFNKENRYVTCGIDNYLPPEIQITIWQAIDTKKTLGETLDYLQVAKFNKHNDTLLLIHIEQEQPQSEYICYLPYVPEYEDLLTKTVYVIDDGDHSTMLFSKEY